MTSSFVSVGIGTVLPVLLFEAGGSFTAMLGNAAGPLASAVLTYVLLWAARNASHAQDRVERRTCEVGSRHHLTYNRARRGRRSSLDSLTSLKRNTVDLLNLFNARVERMRNKEGYRAIVKRLDEGKAKETLLRILGKGTFTAMGIDGSMDQVESLEMLLFYVNAAVYSCNMMVSDDGVTFALNRVRKENKLGATSAVPLWLEDCSTVAATVGSQESEFEHTAALMNISFSLMLMAELTSALASFEDQKLKVLFLDRPLSGSYHALGRDVRNLLLKEITPLERLYEKDLKRDLYLATAFPVGGAPWSSTALTRFTPSFSALPKVPL